MECPRCGKDKFSSDGTCLACNYRPEQPETVSNENRTSGRQSDVNPAGNPPPSAGREELPPWRQELTRRLEALKNEQKTGRKNGQGKKETAPAVSSAKIPDPVVKPAAFSSKHAGSIQVQKQIPETEKSTAKQRPEAPQQKTLASLLEERMHSTGDTPRSRNIREIIDEAISRKSASPREDTPLFIPGRASEKTEDKSILLSRTLSGLIDLFFVIICTGAFIIAADFFSGLVLMDSTSILESAVLFLMVFFLYSVFFLATSGQTIGMMITDLRIMGIEGSRPSIGQLFSRCLGYLLSVAIFGAGLFWGLFDRRNRCFHDRFSNTSIMRL